MVVAGNTEEIRSIYKDEAIRFQKNSVTEVKNDNAFNFLGISLLGC